MEKDKNGYTKYSKHQRIVSSKSIYNEEGELVSHEIVWDIPKVITSDVSFQLQFGFWPGDNWESSRVMQSYGLNNHLKSNHIKFYNR